MKTKMKNTNDGLQNDEQKSFLIEKLQKSLQKPHVSVSGNFVCTNPQCKTRMIKSNATIELNSVVHKAVMINSKTKVFILGKSLVLECVCGTRYSIDNQKEQEK